MHRKRGTARIRGLAAELKDLRHAAGLNTREAARRVGMSPASLNRMELGNRTISPEDMSALLVVYGVTGPDRQRLLALAREADQSGWWETLRPETLKRDHRQPVLSQHLRALIKFESDAARITHVAMLRVPGLLQTADYIRALMTTLGVPPGRTETMVATRLARQEILRRMRPPQYVAIVDEAAISRPIGGPAVMADQIRHIIDLARLPHIEVRVIPFALGGHIGLDGSYAMLEFAKQGPIVLLEHKRSSGFVDEPEDVVPFRHTTTTLMETALAPLESVNFLAAKAAYYDRS